MSKKAFSATKTKTAKQEQHYKTEALVEIKEFLAGCLYQQTSWHLTPEEAENLYQGIDIDLSKKSAGARWLAARFVEAGRCGADMPVMADLQKKLAEERRLLRWMRNNEEWMIRLGLADLRTYRYAQEGRVDIEPYIKYFPQSLIRIGVRTPNEARKFCDLYEKIYEPERVWLSGCQIDQREVALIALTPNYSKLPLWVKKAMTKAPHSALPNNAFGKDRRIGNIWRLISCARAWKWAKFRKRIAEKIGRLSPKTRILASALMVYEDTPLLFWEKLSQLSRLSLVEQIEWLYGDVNSGGQYWEKHKWKAFLSESLNVPYGIICFKDKFPSKKDVIDIVLRYGDPKTVCDALFGVSGKATIRLFQQSNKTAILWASALAHRNPDATQKILKIDSESLIEFEGEAVPLLKSIPQATMIRLLTAKNFKYQGKIEQVTKDHVRDSGYLWSNISEKPTLGRIRGDWFSLHEKLAAAFVRQLPNEPLPVDEKYGQIDKVCAIDGSWEIEFPRDVATLKYWGRVLKNCIGGYGPAIKSGRSIIFGVLDSGTISHCVEICENSISQFYGYGNGQPDPDIYAAVSELLKWLK